MTKDNEVTVIDTPDGIDMYRLLALKGALKLAVVGLKPRRGISLIRVAKQYGFKGRTHREALEYIEALVAAIDPKVVAATIEGAKKIKGKEEQQ